MEATGISIDCLSGNDIGRWVKYYPSVGPRQTGRIKSWNEKWVFVVYNCDHNFDRYQDYTAATTDPNDLEFIR